MGSSGIPELYNSGIIPEVRLKADLIPWALAVKSKINMTTVNTHTITSGCLIARKVIEILVAK